MSSRRRSNLRMLLSVLVFGATALVVQPLVSAQAPTVDTLKQALNKSLLELRPQGFTERQVLFQEVRAGTPKGDEYPFQVTALIRDYGPGYPANRFYGETCVGRMNKSEFTLKRNSFGQWQVFGAMSVTSGPDKQCKPNPSAGVSSIPLASLQGTPAPAGNPAAAPAPASRGNASSLADGEWACYGNGQLMGLGFRVVGNGKYTDLDSKESGSYTVQAGSGTVTFRGGHLDGRTGRSLRNNGFDFSSTVHCEKFQ